MGAMGHLGHHKHRDLGNGPVPGHGHDWHCRLGLTFRAESMFPLAAGEPIAGNMKEQIRWLIVTSCFISLFHAIDKN